MPTEAVTQTLPTIPARTRGRSRRGRVPPSGLALVVLAVVAGLAGALLAPRWVSGPPAPAPRVGDGFVWLPDPASGEAVQVDAGTGEMVARVAVAEPGQGFALAQSGQSLAILDSAGRLSIVDARTQTSRGSFPAGPDALMLVNASGVYVADLGGGSVVRLDQDARPMGRPWSAGAALVHAALDGEGTVWALSDDGLLHRLVWTDGDLVENEAPLAPSGVVTRAVLVAHEAGTTVVAPEAGVAQRFGTGADATVAIPRASVALLPATTSPADLAPVSLDGRPTLQLVTGSSGHVVDLGPYGCDRPAQPAVLHDRVYVPCRGVGRVVPLDASGEPITPVLALGPGDPILVVDEGRLVATVPGASRATMVGPDGATATIHLVAPAPAEVPEIVAPSRGPGRRPPPTVPPPPGPPGVPRPSDPTGASAKAVVDGTVVVAWSPGAGADSYAVLNADTGQPVSADFLGRDGDGREVAVVTGLRRGASVSFVVQARNAGGTARSNRTNPVTVILIPGAPMNVRDGTGTGATVDGSILVSLVWDTVPGELEYALAYYEVTLTAKNDHRDPNAPVLAETTVKSEPNSEPTGGVDGIRLACDACGAPPRRFFIIATVSLRATYQSTPIASTTAIIRYCDVKSDCTS